MLAVISAKPGYILEVICNDAGHAGGKVAEIDTFARFTLPNGEVRWLIRDGDGWSYTVRPRVTRGARVDVYRRYDAEPEKGSTYVWSCKRCRRAFEVREGTLDRLCEAVYQGRLKIGAPNEPISIATLRRVAASI